MSGVVVDISESGAFIETVMPLEPGIPVRLTPLKPEDIGMFEIKGVVVRKNDFDDGVRVDRPPGMGVRFLDVSGETLARLRALFSKSTFSKSAGSKSTGSRSTGA